jgi:transcriptional antiterminator RfaH
VLKHEGLEAYCPLFREFPSDPKSLPLFPGYVFVRLSPRMELSRLRTLPGVQRPLLFNNQLACLEEKLIDHWRVREGGRGYLSPERKMDYKPGQKVRFKQGAFGGLEAVILEVLPARQRVKLLLDHLGGTLQLEVDGAVIR